MARSAVLAVMLLVLWAMARPVPAADDFTYLRSLGDATDRDSAVVVDARALADCRARSLAGARCLPADGLLGPQRRLPSARDLLWLLGAAGLSGSETVIVVGQDATSRDFVAGLLYLAGQRQVRILAEPVARVLGAGVAAAPGRERGMVRETVFEAPMRDGLWVLRDELRDELRDALRSAHPAPALLDGRVDDEYWGETARAQRTGHLPGAISLPAARLRAALLAGPERRPVLPQGPVVAYAHDAFEGLAYLALLTAGHGVAARVYPEGWAEWAADGTLPADAVGYPERGTPAVSAQAKAQAPATAGPAAVPTGSADARPGIAWPRAEALLATALALGLAAFAGGWWLAGRRAAR
ncbi:MAG: rhodanese-like domain-containing protein [Burkholderiaceae bacterium]